MQAEEAHRNWEKAMIRTTVTGLFNIMRSQFRNFPNDYIVVDVETTGVKQHKGGPTYEGDLITQVGYCIVKGGRSVNQAGLMLNWYDHPGVDPKWLTERMQFTKAAVEQKDGQPTGKTYHMNPDVMKERGSDPIATLNAFRDVLEDARNAGMFFVAHNGYHFDARMLSSHFSYWLRKPWDFTANELFDTGMVFKGAQCNAPVWLGDSVKDWAYRIYKMRMKGVKWALDKACVTHFGLDIKDNLQMGEAHDAGVDSYICHLLFEEYKEIAIGRRKEPLFRT